MIATLDLELGQVLVGEKPVTSDIYRICEREGVLASAKTDDEQLSMQLLAVRRQAVAAEMATRRQVQKALDALASAGIRALVFKGTALAYSIYPEPWQRLRSDTDIIVSPSQAPEVGDVLVGMGYEKRTSNAGDLITCEAAWDYEDELGVSHTLDVHWRLNNCWRLAALIDFESLWRDRVVIPVFGERSFRCSNAHALAIACMHRAAHLNYIAYQSGEFRRLESDFTLWIYDLHLLAGALDDADWEVLTNLMIERGMARFMKSGLDRSREIFGTCWPSFVDERVDQAKHQLEMAQFNSEFGKEWQSLLALPGIFKRVRYVGQHLFPQARYMRAQFGEGLLGWLYLKRILAGVGKRLGRDSPQSLVGDS